MSDNDLHTETRNDFYTETRNIMAIYIVCPTLAAQGRWTFISWSKEIQHYFNQNTTV